MIKYKIVFLIEIVSCWVYLHNPPGSNNRLNEQTSENKNAQRLFQSNNHRRGGYNVPDNGPEPAKRIDEQFAYTYFAGSILRIEWSQLNGCHSFHQNCSVIIQGLCGDELSNGMSMDSSLYTAGNDEDYIDNLKKDKSKLELGLHESWLNYHNCPSDSDNKKYGYECNAERKFYPYHYSPFFDIAHLSNQCIPQSRVNFVCMQKSSKKNYLYKFYSNEADCKDGEWIQVHNIVHTIDDKSEKECNSEFACRDCRSRVVEPVGLKYCDQVCESETTNIVWGYYLDQKSIEMGWKLKKKCLMLPNPILCSRPFETTSGFLSNYDDGEYPRFDYTLPDVSKNTKCILRVRYNVTQIADTNSDLTFEVYQDRSHVFEISPRPEEIPKSRKIVNLNVRGKRGNIVQTYPSVEYDFIPNRLKLRVNDAVHLQWAGSNSHKNNPTPGRQEDGQTGDDGQGKSGSDRSNFVQIPDLGKNFPLPYEHTSLWDSIECLWSSSSNGKCKESNRDLAIYYAYSGYYHCYEGCGAKSYTQSKEKVDPLLNTAPASVKGHIFSFNKPGNYTYMSSRNNNFSNRSQKGQIIVNPV